MKTAIKILPLISDKIKKRFWIKVKKTETCWIWIGAKNKKGYGNINIGNGITIMPHRLSWAIHFGEIPDGLVLCHRCDNPSCVNPNHHFVGTSAENRKDAVVKKRMPYAPNAKISQKIADEIRQLKKNGRSQISISKEFKVSPMTISFIIRNKIWIHG